MRAGFAFVITVVLCFPSLLDTISGRLTPEDFGIRVLVAALFAILSTGAIALFAKAATPAKPQPEHSEPGRRKTDTTNP